MVITPDSTNVSVDIRAMTSVGTALEGKVATDFVIWYRRDGAKTSISLSNLSALTDAHTDGGIIEIDDGWYRLDLPDAAVATGANRVVIGGTVDGGILLSGPISLRPDHTTAITTIDTLMDRFAPAIIGTASGSRSGVEVFIYNGVTMTSTVDDDGNRTSVVFS